MNKSNPFRKFGKIGARLSSVGAKIIERVTVPLIAIAAAIASKSK